MPAVTATDPIDALDLEPIVFELADPEDGEIRLDSYSWCGGTGYWNGWPCIKCNPQPGNDEDDSSTTAGHPPA